MKRNYSELIKDKAKRTLTAKGYKFVWQCIDIVAMQRNSNKYAPEMKPLKERLKGILTHLIIDREMTIAEIKQAVENRTLLIAEEQTKL